MGEPPVLAHPSVGYARVCMGVRRYAQVYIHVCGWVPVCVGLHTYTWVWVCGWVSVSGWVLVCADVYGLRKCASVFECVRWRNFQNNFWTLKSIHQRTLIHILYEVFQCHLSCLPESVLVPGKQMQKVLLQTNACYSHIYLGGKDVMN